MNLITRSVSVVPIALCTFPQDDMIDDVESFVKVAEILKDRGAYKVFVMATHGILSSDAPSLIEDSCIDEVCSLTFFPI